MVNIMSERERTTEPTQIAKGERINWTRSIDGFPATEFTLEYRVRGNGPGLDVTATADGDGFNATITAAQSATLIAGERYKWQGWLTEIADPANTWLALEGDLTIRTGFVADDTNAIDMRTDAKRALDAVNAALLNKATNDQLEYEITTPAGSRKLKRYTVKEMLDLRTYFAKIVRNERAAERVRNGGKFGRTVVGRLKEI